MRKPPAPGLRYVSLHPVRFGARRGQIFLRNHAAAQYRLMLPQLTTGLSFFLRTPSATNPSNPCGDRLFALALTGPHRLDLLGFRISFNRRHCLSTRLFGVAGRSRTPSKRAWSASCGARPSIVSALRLAADCRVSVRHGDGPDFRPLDMTGANRDGPSNGQSSPGAKRGPAIVNSQPGSSIMNGGGMSMPCHQP